jgi:hypothetical protein
MKKIMTICFGIITILGSVWSMILLAGNDNAEILFYLIGATVLGLICLTLIAFWIGVLIIFIALVKQTIVTGQGVNFLVSSLFKKALDK